MRSIAFMIFSVLVVVGIAIKPPVWEPTYTIEGSINIPYSDITEPFYAWYDNPTGRSRIDYYGGMVKTYQLSLELDNGISLEVVPVSNNTVLNVETCYQTNGTVDNYIDIQSILPDCTNFKFAGIEDILNVRCHKFVYVENTEQKQSSYTIWVYYKTSTKYPHGRMPIPVRYEMNGLDTLLDSHFDNYYLDYSAYGLEEIPSNIFEVNTIPCIAMDEYMDEKTLNPMKEYVYPQDTSHVDKQFNRFIEKHGKLYNSSNEQEQRKNIFKDNLRYINSKNRANLGYTLSVNPLADKTSDELKTLKGLRPSGYKKRGQSFPYNITAELANIPEQFDWRVYGAVSPVKDQAICGSCWAFAVIGVIEGAFFVNNGGHLVPLSAQALLDCSWGYDNAGCDGGDDAASYEWMLGMGGTPTDEAYGKYLGVDGYCHVNNASLVAPITSWVNVTSNSADALKTALYKNGPIAVSVDADHRSFVYYAKGILYEPKCNNGPDDVDHLILLVGYGIMNGELYWILKNSWSIYWGDNGYILISARDNNCGVMTMPSFVTM